MKQVRDLFKKYFFAGLLLVLSAWASCSVPEAFMSTINGLVSFGLLSWVLVSVRGARHPVAGGVL